MEDRSGDGGPTAATGAVLIPVKAFTAAKGRLGTRLDGDTRAQLAREMATHVVRAQGNVEVAIACDDDDVAAWARQEQARVIWCPGTDLNGAIAAGFEELAGAGHRTVAIAHSDLPEATDLAPLLGWPGVTIVPDRHRTGTNVMVVPTDVPFAFSYGEGSFRRHVAEAVRHRRGLRVVHDEHLGFDIDHPSDLDETGATLVEPYRRST